MICVHTRRVIGSFFWFTKKTEWHVIGQNSKKPGKRLWSCAQPFLLRGLPLQEFSPQFLLGRLLQNISSAGKKSTRLCTSSMLQSL